MNEGLNDDPDGAEGEVKEVFAHYGRAVYAASCLETGLVIALMKVELMAQTHGQARRERKAPSKGEWEAQFDAYMDRHHSFTLGTLIERFRSVWRVDASLDALLDHALSRRNFLTHVFFRDRAVEFAHSDGRHSMIEELEAAHALLTRTDEAVQTAVAPILPKLGIDPDRHRAQVEDIMHRSVADGVAASRRS
ncbi:MAG: hypothetical protein P4L76_15325 [Beijerinckiaceae bacterium]|nr:hypothetical protein [Beijerinckiaceae bacterium]